MSKLSLPGTTLLLSATAALSACGWVDSTGNQDMETQSVDAITVANTIFESSVQISQPGEAIWLLENTVNRLLWDGPLSGGPLSMQKWQHLVV